MTGRATKTTNKLVAVAASAMLMTGAAVERAQADLHGAVIGGIILCGLSGGCGNNGGNSGTRAPRNPGISSAQRQQNREVQGALNAFNFPVGTVDGSIGPRSRAAIRDYQGYMGMPATGQLTDFERNTLVDSHRRLQAGAGQAFPNMMAREGPRGLLRTAVNPNYPSQFGDRVPGAPQVAGFPNQGVPQQPFPNNNAGFQQPQQGGQFPNTAGFQAPQPQAPQGGQTLNQTPPQQTAGLAPLAPLAPLQPVGTPSISAASRCEVVELTARAQGVMQASNITDADQALSEKFCDARSFSIAQGTHQASQFAVSENELLALCGQIETAFTSKYGQLSGSTTEQIRALVTTTAGPLGLTDPGTATAYGKICLGLGYRQDNAEMALAGALTLMNAGQAPYSELIGHHLREGFGVSKAPAAAGQWYDEAITALETGATPAFDPSTTRERVGVIRAAMEMSGMNAGL